MRGPPLPYILAIKGYSFPPFLLSQCMKKNLLVVLISLITTEIGEPLYLCAIFALFFALFTSHLCICFICFLIGLRVYGFYINFLSIKVIHAK